VAKKPVRKTVRNTARRPVKAPRRTVKPAATAKPLAAPVGGVGAAFVALGGPLVPLQGSATIEVPACEVETQVRNPVGTMSAVGVAVLPPGCLQINDVWARCYNQGDAIPAAPPNDPGNPPAVPDPMNVRGAVVAARHWEFRAAGNEIPAAQFGPSAGACPNLLVVWVQFVVGGAWIRDMKRVYGLASNRTDLDP